MAFFNVYYPCLTVKMKFKGLLVFYGGLIVIDCKFGSIMIVDVYHIRLLANCPGSAGPDDSEFENFALQVIENVPKDVTEIVMFFNTYKNWK